MTGSAATAWTALRDGNFVVCSPFWQLSANIDVGAVTWVSASASATGLLSGANSLIGGTQDDRVGSNGVAVLTNGNFVVGSPSVANRQQQLGCRGCHLGERNDGD